MRSSACRRRPGKYKAIEDLSRYPDWTLQVANVPAVITCTDVMAEEHPELVVTFMKGMIKVGRWANEHKHAAAAILDKQTFYLDVEDTYRGIKDVDMVPNLSPQNLVSVEIGKDFMLSHGYIANDFDVHEWAAPEFLEQAARDLLEEEWAKRSMSRLPEGTELHAAHHPARLGVAMAKTARTDGRRGQRAHPRRDTAGSASSSLDGGHARCSSTCASPPSGRPTSPGASRSPAGSWRPRPTPPARGTTRPWTRAGRSSSTADPVHAPPSQASR